MIDFKSTLKIALNSLKVNKMRSALTSLGIIIGVSAVIIMLAIRTGANKQVQTNMESMGSNLLIVRSATAKSGGLIGVIAGIIIAFLIGALFGTNIVITISPILLSFGFSGLVGIGFGYYPAYKASLLNPIDALRYE